MLVRLNAIAVCRPVAFVRGIAAKCDRCASSNAKPKEPDTLVERFIELRKRTPKSEFLAKLRPDDLKRELEKR